MNPKIPLSDPRFVYRSSVHTNLAETFERVRAEAARALLPVAWVPKRWWEP
jgi:hypothetical protein